MGGGTKTCVGVGIGLGVGLTGGFVWPAITTAFSVAVSETFVAVGFGITAA